MRYAISMTITTTQKIIKIGTSKGVTIPAKDLRQLQADTGDELIITIERSPQPSSDTTALVALTQKLIARHKKALDNLSQR
ncbi:hypothetical protein A2707_05550 [Candidatus Saccharibacteria bacterium RIFCSPHIGHO2_01_FULL_45_15]|nr:MAG: hypothetical protein A2707_05550 [Candidatus Saccharibacteria bacterium RIFCSPHIGHO2_01_FULL_45_15]OGL28911.1 MAG: hypothetical protein A3C39_05765 [Candidatus Saccharibacteria bacterium RIFCSPHIGHO2_02_FULL_46_12]OGL31924.1 MAG: hypothetical protein A3E76_01495 [Candidatus Saccharibacteria bacterium RIFCSPHIGHO2_12_FULL_44_22]